MKACTIVLSLSFLMSGHNLKAAETDTFTNRDLPLNDSSEIVNKSANENITESLQELKARGIECDEEELYKELRKRFGNHGNSTFDEKFTIPLKLNARDIKLEDSVYQDWNSWDGLGMGIHIGNLSKMTMSSVIRVGNQLIGEDKLEHMFGQGYYYFSKNYLKNKGSIAAVKQGVLKEKTILGGNKFGNGVFSYGDLSANLNGMRFWNHILQLRDDVLGKKNNIGPYISCVDKQYVQVKTIDFKYYIDDSMDEATNCAKFPSKKTAIKFTARLAKLGMKCPLDPSKVEKMKEKYGEMSSWMINDKGTGAIRYTGEFRKH